MTKVIMTYRDRITDLEKDPRLRYTLIYKNSGRNAGAVFSHPLYTGVDVPGSTKEGKGRARRGEKSIMPIKTVHFLLRYPTGRRAAGLRDRVITETHYIYGILPYASKLPFETWIIPKRHSCTFQDIRHDEIEDMALIVWVC